MLGILKKWVSILFPHLLLFFPSFQKARLGCLRMFQFFKNLILTVHDSDWQIQCMEFFFPAIIKKTLANYSLQVILTVKL